MTHKSKIQLAITTAMGDLGITQVDIAKHYQCTRQAVNQWLRTESVSYDKLFELADTLGLEVEVLVRYK
jgi:transcriptional regulator with XRE-family HTH domain